MAKKLPGLFGGSDLLDQPAELWAEMSVYAAEEARVQMASAERAERRNRTSGGSGRKMPGRRGRRG